MLSVLVFSARSMYQNLFALENSNKAGMKKN
jgi:hypothetical protein